ncbi:MAG: hypothetical protein NPIRA03_06690 [Nitrospirales bacterium]|nr:MAG: hypothetical protein NPIRA03_06690 [Nitrospirales bacterium]
MKGGQDMASLSQLHGQIKTAAVDYTDDIDLGEIEDPYPLIPEGIYDVAFLKAHRMRIGKAPRLLMYFQICDPGQYHGIVLIMGVNYPKNGKKKWGALSKMAECYRIAAGRNPDRFDVGRVSTSIFKGKVLAAKVSTVKRGRNQISRDESSHYSVIEKLVDPKFIHDHYQSKDELKSFEVS